MSVVFAKIQMRRGTAAQWAAANPILAQGELAFETDTGLTKVGDGATAYASLPAYATYDQMLAAKEALDEAALDVAAVEASRTAAAASAATATTKAGEASASAAAALASEQSIVAKVNQAEQARIDAIAYAAVAETKADEIVASAQAAAADASAADADRIAAEAARTGAEAAQAIAQGAAAGALASEVAADASADTATGAAAQSLAIYGSVEAQQTAVATAQAQASLAAGFAASAASVVQQDLSGVTAQALHRSPNAITAMYIYDTSKDSDGGAWTEKCQHTSWWNEAINGKWLGAQDSEFQARYSGSTVGAELISNGGFDTDTVWGKSVFGSAPAPTIANGVGILPRVNSSNFAHLGQSITAPAGVYRVTVTAPTTVRVRAGTGSLNGSYLDANFTGTQTLYFVATAANPVIAIFSNVDGVTATVDNVSVRQVTALTTAGGDYFQLTTDGRFYRLSKNLLVNTAAMATQTQFLGAGTYTLSSTTGSSGSVAVSGAATASHTAGGGATTFTVASAGNVTFTVTGSVLTAMCEQGSVATTYEANGASRITEVFRGNKRDFPRLAGIVLEGGLPCSVVIYDLTEPGRPMWMSFYADGSDATHELFSRPQSSVAMLNGIMVTGHFNDPNNFFLGALTLINFPRDDARRRLGYYSQSLVSMVPLSLRQANLPGGRWEVTGGVFSGTAAGILAVSMSVLPDAPVDPVSGLRIPTVAAATYRGIQVLRPSGVMVESSLQSAFDTVVLTPSLLSAGRADGVWYSAANPAALGASFALAQRTAAQAPGFSIGNTGKLVDMGRSRLLRRSTTAARAQMARAHESDQARSLIATVGNDHNTGWMTGDIRRCFLSDAEVGSVTGPELVTNGTFDTDTTGWAAAGTLVSFDARGAIRVEPTTIFNSDARQTSIPTKIGATYRVTFDVVEAALGSGGSSRVGLWASEGDVSVYGFVDIPRTVTTRTTYTFVAVATSASSTFRLGIGSNTGFAVFDNVSVREAIPDRSYKAQGANITGTLTRAQLASGTSLVGYSGFSAANYLRENWSADLDFGTGEWTGSAWVNIPATLTDASFGATSVPVALDTAEWNKGTGWSAPSANSFSCNGSQTGATDLSWVSGNRLTSNSGIIKRWTVTVTAISGTLVVYANNGSPFYITAPGTYYGYSNPTSGTEGTAILRMAGAGQTCTGTLAMDDLSPSRIVERAHTSGPSFRLGINRNGQLTATVSDGTTARTVTTPATYNIAQWLKARVSYTTDGTLAILVNGREVAATRGAPLLTLNNASAVLTIGNSFALDAPFPGSIALLKLGATVPTPEQATFMFEQEKQLFRAGALSVLPDSGAIVDMAYDDATDRWVAISAANESYWTGLVRNSVQAVPAGSFSRVVAGSGLELAARTGTNPGVDVTIPAYGLREELVRRAEAAARLSRELVAFDFVGGFTANTTNGSAAITNVAGLTYPGSLIGARVSGAGIPANTRIVGVSGTTIYLSAAATATATGVSVSFLDFNLPVGMQALSVLSAGALRREGATQDYVKIFDGFVEAVRFAVAPGATAWVQVHATKGA